MQNIKPNVFIIAGVPRAGTTFLFYYLKKHPQVFSANRKEINFFSLHYDRGEQWYGNKFKGIGKNCIGIDASPSYFMTPESIPGILEFDPDIKVILGIRDPVQWAISFYQQVNSQNYDVEPFQEFLQTHLWVIDGEKIPIKFTEDFYMRSIQDFQKAFGRNIFLFNFSMFEKNPLEILSRIENFLCISSYFNQGNFKNILINASNRYNKKYLSVMLKSERFISFINKILPQKAINKLRDMYMISTSPSKKGNKQSLDYHKIAQKVFINDEEFVKNLFKDSDIVLGDGTQFIH